QADHSRGSFFCSADHAIERVGALGVQNPNQVGAIIHRDLRLVIDRGKNVAVVRFVVLALDRKNRDAVVAHQAGGNVILGGKRVRCAQSDIGAAVAEADSEVPGFGGDVQ